MPGESAAPTSGKTLMKNALVLLGYFTGSCFSAASAGYFLLHLVMPEGWVFGALYRMPLYHWNHPYQYIAIIAVIYGLIATTFAITLRHRVKVSRWWMIFVILLTIAIASPAGGVLWVIHDMQEGYFTEGARFWSDLGRGAREGVKMGWLVILLSLPYNLLGMAAGYFVTRHGFQLARATRNPGRPPCSLAGLEARFTDENHSEHDRIRD